VVASTMMHRASHLSGSRCAGHFPLGRRPSFCNIFCVLLVFFLQQAQLTPATNLNLEPLGSLGGSSQAVAIDGDLAWVCQGYGVSILDVSSPSRPVTLGHVSLPDLARAVAVHGSLACVADNLAGLQVIDVSDPSKPTLKGSCSVGTACSVALSGNLAFVGDESGHRLWIVDIGNPSAPSMKNWVETWYYPSDIAASGDLVFGADLNAVDIIDVSDPTTPVPVGSYSAPPGGSFESVAMKGSLAFVGDYFYGLDIFDVSDPAMPAFVGGCPTPEGAYDVAVSGNLAFVAGYGWSNHPALHAIDVSNPAAPVFRGSYPTPDHTLGVAALGSTVLVADGSSGLLLLDASTPTTPVLRSTYGLAGSPKGVTLAGGNLAYVAAGNGGLWITDVSNPAAPRLKSAYPTPGWAWEVAV